MSASRVPARLLARLHRDSRAERWQVSSERFAEAVDASVAKAIGEASAADVEAFVGRLHLADLALACGCAEGNAEAWEHFVREHRPALYRAADALLPGGVGRELADSLYGELYGLSTRDGQRRSLFRYFHGRASLSTWLRAVLAQRSIDRVRVTRTLDPLPDDDQPGALPQSAPMPEPERPRWIAEIGRAMGSAIRGLPDRDRLRLSLYYAQAMTLAEIGRALGEHEATVSRHLARTRRDVRAIVERDLRERAGMDEATIAEAIASVVRDTGSLDLGELIGASRDRKESDWQRSQ